MAFGFGFNKQKVLNSAEKFVQQGKLQNAITEYEKILKADSKDLTVLNTVGDLYARLGESDRAADCFKNVGDAYAAQGFTVKAIAMYKKLSKLKSSLDCVLRLAELYTQQGLFNDARAQYKQVAEEFLRSGELEQAVRIFQKILEMDPENVAMRAKLAEVYIRLGKKTDAWQIFSAAAESLRARGANSAADEIVQRMLTLDPANSQALLLRGEMLFESGDLSGSIQHLLKVADLDSHPDGLRTLFRAYLQTGRLPEAGPLAAKLLSVHNDTDAVLNYTDSLVSAAHVEEALQVYEKYADCLLAANPSKVVDTLHSSIGQVRTNPAALETVLALLNRSGDTTHVTEVCELLAHAYVQAGQLEKARDYYLKLTQLEPQNQLHTQNYQQVVGRLGGGTGGSLITVEEGATLVDELEATAPFVDQRYADDVALSVRAALTDAELFISYNMPNKALAPLLAALPKAPRDLRLNQRLAALHTRAGRFAEAAACCRTLEEIYHEAGCPDEATRYGELAGKYEERASAHAAEVFPARETQAPEPQEFSATQATPDAAVETAVMEVEPEVTEVASSTPTPTPSRSPGLFWHARVTPPSARIETNPEPEAEGIEAKAAESEIDLSAEWEGALTGDADEAAEVRSEPEEVTTEPAADEESAAEVISSTIAEIRFYLTHSMVEQARAALSKLEQLGPDADTLSVLEDEVSAATTRSAFEQMEPEEAVIEEADGVPEAAEAEPALSIEDDSQTAEPEAPVAHESAFDRFAPATPVASPPAVEWPQAAPAPAVQAAFQEPGSLSDFVADLESSLGDSFLPGSASAAAAPAAAQIPQAFASHAAPAPAPREVGLAARAAVSSSIPAPATPATFQAPPASPTFSYQPRPVPAAETPASTDASLGVDLADMFGELRQELEEDTSAAKEDPETHYNLGVAFREMGLLDEAIGELQKVCQAVDRGVAFPQLMQTYTWLAQCFLDKGVPEAAIRWYDRALGLPNLDAEARTALHYELACSYEAAHNKPAALQHFLEVYGSNIDYRDVAERIKTLKS